MKVLIKVHTAVQIRWRKSSSKSRPFNPSRASFVLVNPNFHLLPSAHTQTHTHISIWHFNCNWTQGGRFKLVAVSYKKNSLNIQSYWFWPHCIHFKNITVILLHDQHCNWPITFQGCHSTAAKDTNTFIPHETKNKYEIIVWVTLYFGLVQKSAKTLFLLPRADGGFKPRIFLLWGSGANHHDTQKTLPSKIDSLTT